MCCLFCAAVSPSRTPREYFGRDHETQKQQCFRVYRGVGYKGYELLNDSSAKLAQLAEQANEQHAPLLLAITRKDADVVDMRCARGASCCSVPPARVGSS